MKRTSDGTKIDGSQPIQNTEQHRVEAPATSVPVFPARVDIAHLGSQSNENSVEQFNDSNGVANHDVTIDQRQVGAVIEKSYFSGANIKPKIESQQNYTVENMTVVNQYGQPTPFHNNFHGLNSTSIDGHFGSGPWSVGGPNAPPQRWIPSFPPQPRPRSSMSRSSSDKAEGSFGGQYREENMQRGMRNDAPRPSPPPRGGVRRTGEFTPSRSYKETLPTPQPLPQPRRDVESRNYTQVSDKIWFYNVRPLREFSRVYDAILTQENHLRIVVKLTPHTKDNLKSVEALYHLEKHPNVVQVLDYDVIFGLIKEIYVAMELCSQNLRHFVHNVKDKPMNFRLHATYSKQLMTGLTFLHSKGIIHSNLKPDNILFSQNMETIKISDSGSCKNNFYCKDDRSALPGDDGYRAPEIYIDPPELTYSSDVFSMGVIVFYLFTNGSHPFGTKQHDWGYNIRHYKNRDLSLLYHPEVPVLKKPQLLYMINGALHQNACSRPTAKKLLENHFFEGVSSEFNVISNNEAQANSHQAITKPYPGLGRPVQKMVKSLSDDDLYIGNKATQQKLGPLHCTVTQCLSLQDLTKLPDQPTEKHAPLQLHLLAKELGPSSLNKHPPSFSCVEKENRERMEFSEELGNVTEETPAQSSPFSLKDKMSQPLEVLLSQLFERVGLVEWNMSAMQKEMAASRSFSSISARSFSHHAERSHRSGSLNYSGRAGTPNLYGSDDLAARDRTRNDRSGSLNYAGRAGTPIHFGSDDLGYREFNFDRAKYDKSGSLSHSGHAGTPNPFGIDMEGLTIHGPNFGRARYESSGSQMENEISPHHFGQRNDRRHFSSQSQN